MGHPLFSLVGEGKGGARCADCSGGRWLGPGTGQGPAGARGRSAPAWVPSPPLSFNSSLSLCFSLGVLGGGSPQQQGPGPGEPHSSPPRFSTAEPGEGSVRPWGRWRWPGRPGPGDQEVLQGGLLGVGRAAGRAGASDAGRPLVTYCHSQPGATGPSQREGTFHS